MTEDGRPMTDAVQGSRFHVQGFKKSSQFAVHSVTLPETWNLIPEKLTLETYGLPAFSGPPPGPLKGVQVQWISD